MEEKKIVEKQKNSSGLVIALVLAIITILGLVGYIFYDKGVVFKNKTAIKEPAKSKNEESPKQNTEVTKETQTVNKPKCTGTYYGEAYGTSDNGLTYDIKDTYILNEDGTFTASFSGVSGTSGVYSINGNTISFTGKREITADEKPDYRTEDYLIADDCSYIIVEEGDDEDDVNLTLKKQ